jgi:hypothetical protein
VVVTVWLERSTVVVVVWALAALAASKNPRQTKTLIVSPSATSQ